MSACKITDCKEAGSLEGVVWPLRGYAPGNYMGKCRKCGEGLVDIDKHGWHCLSCAISDAKDTIERLSKKVAVLTAENDTLKDAISIISPTPSKDKTDDSHEHD